MLRIVLISCFFSLLQASLLQTNLLQVPLQQEKLVQLEKTFAAASVSQGNSFFFLNNRKSNFPQLQKKEKSKEKETAKPTKVINNNQKIQTQKIQAQKQLQAKKKAKDQKKAKADKKAKNEREKKEKKQKKKDKKLKKLKHPLSYSNHPICGPFLTGTLLYSKPKIPNFLPAKRNLNDDPTDLNQKEEKPSFDWEIGWKIGLGYNMNHDQWDLYSYWTSLSSKTIQTLDSTSYEIQTLVRVNEADLTAVDFVNHNSSYVKFDLNSVDLELGKSFYTRQKKKSYLALRPFIGLKWALLKEEFFIFAKTTQTSEDFPKYMKLPYEFNGIGLSLGLNSYFNVARHFCLIGNLAPALLYGQTKTTLVTVQNSGHLDQTKITLKNEEWLLKPYLKLFAGFSVGGTLCKDRMFLGFQTGYQFDLWLDPKTTISPLNEINSTLELSSFVAELKAEF